MANVLPGLTYVTASDEAVVGGMLLSVVSFLHQHRDASSLKVCVIDGGIEPATWQRFEEELKRWAEAKEISIQLQKLPGELERWKNFPPHWGSWAVYSSLDIFLRDFEGWVVFGDVDLFHGRSIWDQLPQVKECPAAVGAIVDPFKLTSAEDRYVLEVRPEMNGTEAYVNTGYLVVDRSRFDGDAFQSFLTQLAPDILAHSSGKRSLFDQSLLNGYFGGKIALLDESCNRVVRDAQNFDLEAAAGNLHFVGQPKPWKDAEKASPERFVAWAAASDGLGLTQSGCDLEGVSMGGGLGEGMKKLRYRLLGKTAKLKKIESRFSKEKLQQLFEQVLAWF